MRRRPPLLTYSAPSQSILDQIADPDGPADVYLLRGRYDNVGAAGIAVRRSNVTIHGQGSVLEQQATWACLTAGSALTQPTAGDPEFNREAGRWFHLTGLISAGTDTLVWADTAPLPAVGTLGVIQAGVQANWDPNEQHTTLWVTVTASYQVDGTKYVQFSPPFPKAVPTWASEDDARAAAPELERYKVGPYKAVLPANSANCCRGLGLDHSLFLFVDNSPVRNVTFDGFNVRWPRSVPANTTLYAYGYRVDYVDAPVLRNVSYRFSIGDVCLLVGVRNALVDRVTWTGVGRSNGNVPGTASGTETPRPAICVASWGCQGALIRRCVAQGPNLRLSALEINPTGVEYQDCSVVTSRQNLLNDTITLQTVGIFGGGELRHVRTRFDVATGNSSLFPAALDASTARLVDCVFPGDSPDNWTVDPTNMTWFGTDLLAEGTVTFKADTSPLVYGPTEPFQVEDVVPANTAFKLVPLPAGIYRTASIVLSSRTGVTGVTVGGQDVLPPTGLTVPAPLGRLGIHQGFPTTGLGSGEGFERAVRIHTSGSNPAINVVVTGHYLPLGV